MANYIGIDLGTTNSAVAHIDETGRPTIIHNGDGENITPSCVMFEGERVIVGEEARLQWGIAPQLVGARFKRDMGTSKTYQVNARTLSPTQLSAFVLKKLKQDAESAIGRVAEAVVTIPANFSHEAREATMEAAKAAGLNIKYIINEPTAAALYYAFKRGEELGGVYAIYDLGGGTFDISLIRVSGQDVEVLASNGIPKLGGDDFDAAMQRIVARKHKQLTGKELNLSDYSKNVAEADKKSLSKRARVAQRVAQQVIEVTREEFEAEISSLIAQAEMLCEATIEEAGLKPQGIAGVMLVGGSTRIPMVKESVKRVFGQEPISTINVDEVVALGAALYAAYKSDGKHLTSAQKAAVSTISFAEVTNFCFGTISLTDDTGRGTKVLKNSVLIRKNEKLPCSITESFYTVRDGQEIVDCEVTQSIAPETDPRFVKVIWRGQLQLPTGRPANQEIKVTFAYDVNNIMKCSFLDVGTGERTSIDLSPISAKETQAIDKFLVE